jgi:hypothetical protein
MLERAKIYGITGISSATQANGNLAHARIAACAHAALP